MAKSTVSADFARALLEFAVSKGASRTALVERSRIDPRRLQDPDKRIPLAKCAVLMRAGQELCHDPALALHLGESLGSTELSIIGLIGQACETLAEAFVQMNRYERLVAEFDGPATGDRFVLRHEGSHFWLIDTRIKPNDFRELTEYFLARMVCWSRRGAAEQFAKAVHVTHAAPTYRAEYDRIFQVPIVFESDKNALLADEDWLTLRSPLPSRYVFGILSDRGDELLKSLQSSKSSRGRTQTLLMPFLHAGEPSMDLIASKMGLNRQALLGLLKAEGTNFEKVVDELRHKAALEYLNGKKVSVKETAYLVGFSEPVAFSRAFKRWTGRSPSEYTGRTSLIRRLLLQTVAFFLFGIFWLFGALVSPSTGSRPDWMPPQVDIIVAPISWVSSELGPRVGTALAYFVGLVFTSLAIARFVSLLRGSARQRRERAARETRVR
jgi:AraC-like DNA-binding protein